MDDSQRGRSSLSLKRLSAQANDRHKYNAKRAEILRVRCATLSDLIHGKASLSLKMALRIEKAFDVSMDMLLRMQAWYDSYAMRQMADDIEVQRYKPA